MPRNLSHRPAIHRLEETEEIGPLEIKKALPIRTDQVVGDFFQAGGKGCQARAATMVKQCIRKRKKRKNK